MLVSIQINVPLNMPTYLGKTAAADATTAVSSMDAIIICAC